MNKDSEFFNFPYRRRNGELIDFSLPTTILSELFKECIDSIATLERKLSLMDISEDEYIDQLSKEKIASAYTIQKGLRARLLHEFRERDRAYSKMELERLNNENNKLINEVRKLNEVIRQKDEELKTVKARSATRRKQLRIQAEVIKELKGLQNKVINV